MIIQTHELEKIIENVNTLIIDCRSFKEYSVEHLPNSVNMDLFAFHWIDSSTEGLKSFEKQTIMLFSNAGIDDSKTIIFYDEISGILASRGLWLLKCFNHKNCFLLDGGIKKWKEEKRKLETQTNPFKPKKFSGLFNSYIVGYQYVLDNMKNIKIIDSRTPDEYSGKTIRGARGGHIPNSINVDWNLNLDESGCFHDNEKLSKLYPFKIDDEIVTYCHGAYRAANTFLALKKLGYQNVKVYLGSWGEWSNLHNLPIEK